MGKHKTWIVGAGEMAIEYAKVLADLNVDYTVIGRGEESAAKFKKEVGKSAVLGGLEEFLKTDPEIPVKAIVCVNVGALADSAIRLLDFGVENILVEKPGVGYASEIEGLVAKTREKKANVLVAYNRRFYASVIRAQQIIKEDGGVTSFNFEFTEWSHIIGGLDKTKAEHNNWLIGNSSHIIDTAFFLGGRPTDISTYVKGQNALDWHPVASIFSGAGETESGALFSYQANWEAPGRWAIEILTRKHRLVFKPIEQLQIQELGSVAVNPVEDIDYGIDKRFKPGLYSQTKAFVDGNYDTFCSIDDQARAIGWYNKIGGY